MHYRWFDTEENDKDELTGRPRFHVTFEQPPPPIKKPRYFSRTMITGGLLSVILFCYGLNNGDLPIVFLALAFFAGSSRSLTAFLPGAAAQIISNVLFGFSVALFFGAIVMAFM